MEQKQRIRLLQERIRQEKLSGALLFYSRDVFYYTGTAQPCYLAVLPEEYLLFVRSGYESALNEVFIEKARVKEERRLKKVFQEMFSKKLQTKKIATELDIMPVKQFFELRKVFTGYDFTDVSPFVSEQRKIKEPYEIDQIKKACKAVDAGHRAVISNLKEGVTELELAAAIENAHRLAGHEGTFFFRGPDFFMSTGPLSSGPNLFKNSGVIYSITGVGLSPSIPAGPSKRKIMNGDLVVVDIPTLVNGYHADQTRTYILGKTDEKIRIMYDSLKQIADYVIKNIKPGMTCSEIYQMAIKKSEDLKVADTFLNFGRGKKSLMIGHGVGLELNESPIISAYDQSKVYDNYVMGIEMHILEENVGAMKLEDTILITGNGNEILTKSSRQLIEAY